MIKIGITGGIGSGKSVVASLLALSGVPVYIADEESKWLTNNSPVIREKLTALFGPEIYTNEGLNKKLLASHIFNNPKQLQQVNQIIHPEVNRHFSAWVERQTSFMCHRIRHIIRIRFLQSGRHKLDGLCPKRTPHRKSLGEGLSLERRNRTQNQQPNVGRGKERSLRLRYL